MNRTTHFHIASALFAIFLIGACNKSSSPSAPSGNPTPTPTPTPTPAPTISSVAVTGTNAFTTKGATAQFTATATMSDGRTEDRTSSATWQSDNANIATVSSGGVVTAVATGNATISATVSNVRGTRAVAVNIPPRTPDPAPGQRIPLPDIQGFIFQTGNARPDLIAQSCPTGRKYEPNPWQNYMIDALRTLDTRWGYNGKPNRSPSDNNGFPVIAAGDEIAYHFGPGPDQNSPDVYLIDILLDHCGNNPTVTFRHFTGEEPGFWTGAGRLPSGNGIAPLPQLLRRPE